MGLLTFVDGRNMTLRSTRNCITSHKNRTISNTADRTWNHTTVNPAVSVNFPIQLSLILLTNCQLYSHCNWLQYCFVINVCCMNCYSLNSWNFYSKQRPTISVCNKPANCVPSHCADTSCGIADYITKPSELWIYIGPYFSGFMCHWRILQYG